MGSRGKKKLMMLNADKNNRQIKADAKSDSTFFEEDECHEIVKISNKISSIDSSAKKMVEIDKNNLVYLDKNIENQNPILAKPMINAAMNVENQDPKLVQYERIEAVNSPSLITATDKDIDYQNFTLTVSNFENLEFSKIDKNNLETENSPVVNTTGVTSEPNSSNNGDFSPSEGSQYEPPRSTKHKRVFRTRSSSSENSSSSNSSSSNSDSSSSSSSSSSVAANTEYNEANNKPESPLDTTEDHTEQEINKRQSRKRRKNTHKWKQVVSKRLKNCGKEYTTKRGKTVPAKSIGPPCKNSCRLSCSTKVPFETRSVIFKSYWDLDTHQRQRDFLASCIKKQNPATRRIKITANNTFKPPRKPNSTYYFTIDGKEVRVCKFFLLNTLSIGEKTLRNVIDKISDQTLFIMSHTDNRGKHGRHSHISDEVVKSVRDHINSIPRTESHYLRANTTREYIDGSLTIAELHRDYTKIQVAAAKEFANYDAYHRIFNTDFNLGLFVPRKDQCDECEAYKNAINKEPLLDKHKKHLEEKSLSRLELNHDIEQRKSNDSNTIISIFDLQAILPCPIGHANKKGDQFTVKEMNFDSFIDMKMLSDDVNLETIISTSYKKDCLNFTLQRVVTD